VSYIIGMTIPGLPKLVNQLNGRHWTTVKTHRDKWKDLVWHAVRQNLPRGPLKYAKITCTRYSSSPPDYDNLCGSFKPLIDCLTECGVIEDDGYFNIGVPIFKWAKVPRGAGYVEMWVEEADRLEDVLPPEHRVE
jgi:Holliday junction resolvase RusA-like endonuclease